MTRLASIAFTLLSCSAIAACGTSPTPGGDDEGSGDGPTTLATLATSGISRLALTDDCIVVGSGITVTCVPLAGGAPSTLATLDDDVLSMVGAGSALAIGTTGSTPSKIIRVDGDGTVTAVAQISSANASASGVALDGGDVVFTTGAAATLDSVPLAGGTITPRAFDSGNFGDVVVVGTVAYYVNTPSVYSHDLSSSAADPGDEPSVASGDFFFPDLATDGTTVVVAGTSIEQTVTNLATFPPGPAFQPLPVPGGRLAALDGTAYVIAGGDLFSVDLAGGTETQLTTNEDPIDVLATDARLIWLTRDGRVRAQAR